MKDKRQKIENIMREYAKRDVMIAFSGGVDSTLLLKLACDMAKESDKKVYAVTMKTTLHPMNEMEEAKLIADKVGADFISIEVNELSEADIDNNPVDRCYRCKKTLFKKIVDKAREYNVDVIMDGTNMSDLSCYRPGIKALSELGIKSPLVEADLTKDDVRKLAEMYGLSVATKPSAPCLATRFPYNTPLTAKNLERVDKGENFIKSLGFYNVRVRVHNEIARLEVNKNEFEKIMLNRSKITDYLKGLGYDYVTLDLEGFRSGSMDIHVDK